MLTKLIAIITLFCLLIPQNQDFIPLQLDALGQSKFYLNEINPYSQSTFNLGVVQLDGLDHIPYSSSLMNFNFIGNIDTSNVTSQFNYSRGDYSFRETKILVNNSLSENQNLLFKGHGRKYPGIYNSLGNDYILQNYLSEYRAANKDRAIEVVKYYHKEDINLPIVQDNNSRYSEVNALGLSLDLFNGSSLLNNDYQLLINYQNMFYSGQGYDSQEELIQSSLQKNKLSANYLVDINSKFSSSLYIDYVKNKSKLSDDSSIINLSQIRWSYQYASSYHVINAGLHSVDFLENVYPVFSYTFNSKKKWSFSLKKDYYFELFNLFDAVPKNSRYYSVNFKKEFQKAEFDISLFKVELGDIYTDLIDEKGSLLKFKAKLGNQVSYISDDKAIDFLDVFNFNLVFHNYSNYSPIDHNLNFNVKAKYLKSYESSKYSPYLNFQINYIALNPDYSIVLDSSGFLFENGTLQAISYHTSTIEVGLIFDNFIISYNILNSGPEQYFSEEESNINLPIYQMNYLNVKWQFQD